MHKLRYIFFLTTLILTLVFFFTATLHLHQHPQSKNYNVPLDLSDRVLLVSGATVDPDGTAQLTLYQRPSVNRSLVATPENEEISIAMTSNTPLAPETLQHYPSSNPFATVYRLDLPDDARYISIKIKTSGIVRGESRVDEFGLLHRAEDREVQTENEVLISKRDIKQVEVLSDPSTSEHNITSLKTHRDSLISLNTILAEQESQLNALKTEQANSLYNASSALVDRTRLSTNLELMEKSIRDLEPRYMETLSKLEGMGIEDPPQYLEDLLSNPDTQTDLTSHPTVVEALTTFSMHKSLVEQIEKTRSDLSSLQESIDRLASPEDDPYAAEIQALEQTISAWYETYGLTPGTIEAEIRVLEEQIQALEGK